MCVEGGGGGGIAWYLVIGVCVEGGGGIAWYLVIGVCVWGGGMEERRMNAQALACVCVHDIALLSPQLDNVMKHPWFKG